MGCLPRALDGRNLMAAARAEAYKEGVQRAGRLSGCRPRAPGLSRNVRTIGMLNAAIWPTLDYSRVPYRLYHDPEAYQREQERIFRGPIWNFLGLEAEIPNLGDFRTT